MTNAYTDVREPIDYEMKILLRVLAAACLRPKVRTYLRR